MEGQTILNYMAEALISSILSRQKDER